MIKLLLAYLIFNPLIGLLVLLPYYFKKEKRIQSLGEVLWLVIFPCIGLGRWLYKRNVRMQKKHVLPRKWFIYRNLALVNLMFLLSIAIFFYLAGNAVLYLAGNAKATTNTPSPNNLYGGGIGYGLAAVFEGFVNLILAIVKSFLLVFFLIIAPLFIASVFKSSYYRAIRKQLKELEAEKSRRKQ